MLLFYVFVVTGGLIAAAVTVPACSTGNPHPHTVPAGSTLPISGAFSICFDAPGGVRSLDLFIYRDTLTRPLESHLCLNTFLPDTITVNSRPGDKILVAIANSPAPFREETLQRYESAEQLEMYYREENPEFPLMTAVSSVSGAEARLQFSPLLCRINITHINNLCNYPLRECRVQLRGVNSHVQMLRADGFRTVETEDNPAAIAYPEMMIKDIPGDIGYGLSTPELILFCYPFDGEGPAATSLLFSAIANGERREWSFPLPPLSRGQPFDIELTLK